MLEVQESQDRLFIRMPSSRKNIDAACRQAEDFLDRTGFKDHRFEILLVLREALNNAVIHGNQELPEKIVQLSLAGEPGALAIQVKDQGSGFDWKTALNKPVSCDRPSGRGLAILKHYLKNLTFNTAGNMLHARYPAKGDTHMSDNTQNQILTIETPIVASVVDDLRLKLSDAVDQNPGILTLDLALVDMIDSMGLGLIVATHNTLARKNGRLRLINLSDDLYKLMTVMRLHKHFEIQKTDTE
jgi:anti-anti-sigma factor